MPKTDTAKPYIAFCRVNPDVLGLAEKHPPFAKVYTNLRQTITKAVQNCAVEVPERKFP